jgi:hypothetical protein
MDRLVSGFEAEQAIHGLVLATASIEGWFQAMGCPGSYIEAFVEDKLQAHYKMQLLAKLEPRLAK